jgi:dienelactone hydrolase
VTEVVVFHHAQGLTAGVLAFAEQLRTAGYEVLTPDLFEGQVFDSIDNGMTYVEAVGYNEILRRGAEAVADIDHPVFFIGFSLGVLPAQMLAQTLTETLGAVLCYSCVPATEFGESWPSAVPVQIHGMDQDPFFVDEGDIEAARDIAESSDNAHLFLYSGDQHCFADSSLLSYDAEAADLLMDRILKFLG